MTPAATSSAISVAEYQKMSKEDDTAAIAGQLADLHAGRREHDNQLSTIRERADTQQDRIYLAAKELGGVSDRLHAAENALRESI